MFKKNIFIVCLGAILSAVFTQQSYGKLNDFLIIDAPEWNPGFFSCFNTVVGGLNFYEQEQYAGVQVSFKQGLYVDSKFGPDWWNYYFEPINIGSRSGCNIIHATKDQKSCWSGSAISSISRERAAELIKKYIVLKTPIQNKINDFVAKYFKGYFIIGVHYRGTDKSSEARRVSYEEVYQSLQKVIIDIPQTTTYKIFVATDEQNFINYMQSKFDKKICYQDAIRSSNGKPIHFGQANPYKQGEESLIDCILLSKTNILIKTMSNLSSSAGNFNPQLPIISLNGSYCCPWIRSCLANLACTKKQP